MNADTKKEITRLLNEANECSERLKECRYIESRQRAALANARGELAALEQRFQYLMGKVSALMLGVAVEVIHE